MRQFLLCFCSLWLNAARAQNADARYAVTTAGDTLALPSSAWIAVEKHPHVLVYKDASGTRRRAPASQLLTVRLPAVAQRYARREGPAFVAHPLPARNGLDCWHFVQEVYRQDSVAIYRSVRCPRCQRLELYVQRGDGRMELMGKHNRDRVLREYLPQHPAIAEESRRSNYDVVRLERVLWRMRQ